MSPRLLRLLSSMAAPLAAAALSGCSDGAQAGGQTGGEQAGCLPVTKTPIEPDEPSPLGFSANDARAVIEGSWTLELTWQKGGTTDLDVTVTMSDAGLLFLDREWIDESGAAAEPANGMECNDVIQVDVSVGFQTADGAFAESWTGVALAESATFATQWHDLELAALGGSYVVTEVDPQEYDELNVSVNIELSSAGASGTVDGMATKIEGSGSDGVVSGQPFPVAEF